MQRKALKLLFDALQAIRAIDTFTSGQSLATLLDNELVQAGVERKFEVMAAALIAAHAADPAVVELVPELPSLKARLESRLKP